MVWALEGASHEGGAHVGGAHGNDWRGDHMSVMASGEASILVTSCRVKRLEGLGLLVG